MEKLAFNVPGKGLIDAETNKAVTNSSEYQVVDWPTEFDFPDGKIEDLGEPLIDYAVRKRRESSDASSVDSYEKMAPATASNNFGYENKPALVEAAKFIPGPIGMAAKGINLAMNVNNKAAIDSARNMLGLEDAGFMSNVLKDSKGTIANVDIGDQNYSVGFEAADNRGRTTLTPMEARNRALMSGGLKELSKEEKIQAIKDFKADKKTNPVEIASSMVGNSESYDLSRNMFNADTPLEPNVDRGELKARGMGLMDVSPSFKQNITDGINYTHESTRGPVTTGLTQRTTESMNALAGMQPGGINVTSAFRDPELNRSIGGARNSLHSLGAAYDLSTKNLSDQEKRDLVERAIMSGAEEIGTYGDQSLHIGTVGRNQPLDGQDTGGVAAMYERSRYNLDNAPDWFKEGVSSQSRLAPIPQTRPEPSYMISEMSDPRQDPFAEVMQQQQRIASSPTISSDSTGFMSLSDSSITPFDRTSITEEDRRMAAMTLAGEIDISKTDLTTPDGIKEARAILSTMENRAPKYGSIVDAISAPNQYSTWNNQAAANTATKNYNLNSTIYDNLVNDYFNDPESNMGFTSYHANFVNPDWSTSMQNVTDIGPHKFGSLPEYTKASKQLPNTGPVPQSRPTLSTSNTSAVNTSSGFMSGGANRPASMSEDRKTKDDDARSSTTSSGTSRSSNSAKDSRDTVSTRSTSSSTSSRGSSTTREPGTREKI